MKRDFDANVEDLNGRINQIRSLIFDGSNKEFALKIGEIEQNLSQICLGKRNAGIEIVRKIVDNLPEIDANWLLRGEGEMKKNQQTVGNISNSTVSGVNLHGQNIHIHENYTVLLSIVEKNQQAVEKFQEQIDRLITIIEKKI